MRPTGLDVLDRSSVFHENWRPSTTPVRCRHPDELLARVAKEALLHGETEASGGAR